MKISPINKLTHSDFFNRHINRVINDDMFGAKTLVALNVGKDVFAYGVRFRTTMKNKDIPEEQRPFVASMDLMSGVVTAIMQIGVGFSLANPKIQGKIWDKLFKNCKFNDIVAAKKGFSQVMALIGSTILAERILVPLIATPCAEKFENIFFNFGKENTSDKYHSVTFEQFQKDIMTSDDNEKVQTFKSKFCRKKIKRNHKNCPEKNS